VSSATTYKGHFAETHTERKLPGSCLEMCLSVDIWPTINRKPWMGDRENYVIHYLDGQAASEVLVVVGVKQTVPQNLFLV